MELGAVPESMLQEAIITLHGNAFRLAIGWGCSSECR